MTRKAPNIKPIADVQNSQDSRQIPINKVGIKDIRHPVRIRDRDGATQAPEAGTDSERR